MEPLHAWAAGLFEGEGSLTVRHGKPVLQLKMCDRETVERFAEAVGCGRALGPYVNRAGAKDGYPRSDYYVWTVDAEASQRVLELLWPLLGAWRRYKAYAVGFRIPIEH